MVADKQQEKEDMKGLPLFDSANVVNWSKKLKMWLMRKKRNHLGLEDRPARPPNNAQAQVRADFRTDTALWLERKDTCVSAIYEAVLNVPDALEIVEQYILEKDILPAADPEKEVLAGELLTRLIIRFRGEIQDELGDLNKKFTHFVIQPGEKVCTGIDRLNGIIQKMTQHNQPPTPEARLSKLKEALEIPSLNQLWLTISLKINPTYDEIVATCKRYDKAMDQQRINSVSKIHMTSNGEEKVVCSYPKCGKPGHSQVNCWKRKHDLNIAQLKRAGKRRDFKPQRHESRGKSAPSGKPKDICCFVCGARGHRAADCPDRIMPGEGKRQKNSRGSDSKQKVKRQKDSSD